MSDPVLCPLCGAGAVTPLVSIPRVPVHCNVLCRSRDDAVAAPRADISLWWCESCAHAFNAAFDPGLLKYTGGYENSLFFSPRFREYAEELARSLVERYDLRGKDVLEIGCGQGDFLALLCRLGGNRGLGFDPSYGGQEPPASFTIIKDFYSRRYADRTADLVCCRHVLEHIEAPRDFVSSVREALGRQPAALVFFEVPNFLYTLRDMGIWDLIYEHCHYFTARSLSRLFSSVGFGVIETGEAFGGQFLNLEAVASDGGGRETAPQPDGRAYSECASSFARRFREKLGFWREKLRALRSAGSRTVVWGAGSKGVTFLNALEDAAAIEHVVDINPRKTGMHVAGTGQQIVPPDFVKEYRPQVVLVMNPLYLEEISRQLGSMGVESECIAV